MKRVGLIGARGYTGTELLALIARHPELELEFVSSREHAGQQVPNWPSELRYVEHDADALSRRGVDVVILAVPNDRTEEYVRAFDANNPSCVLIDLSADHRFNSDWYYGLPELTRGDAVGKTRISNPGCYATAMQVIIAPLMEKGLIDASKGVQCFGVSGYSGAGTTPSDKNNPELLHDNLMPYASVNHMHEREVSHRMGMQIEFMPNVAEFFRGISMTVNAHLNAAMTADDLRALFVERYANEPLIRIVDAAPWVSKIAGKHGIEIGGFSVSADGKRVVIQSTEDNLLKGAATQAIQNLNNAFGFDELMSIPQDEIF